MRGTRAAALVMTGIALVEAWPLALVGARSGGPAALLRLLGWHAGPIGALAWTGAAVVAVVYAGLAMTSLPFIRAHLFDATALKLLSVPFALVTGTFEELFFREWLMDFVAAHGWGAAVQVIVSGVVFGVAHALWGLLGGSVRAAGASMLYTAGLGAALGVVYLAAGRHLAPAAWSHVVINLVIEPWLMLGVIDLRAPAQGRGRG